MINPELLAEIQGLAVIEPVEKVTMVLIVYLFKTVKYKNKREREG